MQWGEVFLLFSAITVGTYGASILARYLMAGASFFPLAFLSNKKASHSGHGHFERMVREAEFLLGRPSSSSEAAANPLGAEEKKRKSPPRAINPPSLAQAMLARQNAVEDPQAWRALLTFFEKTETNEGPNRATSSASWEKGLRSIKKLFRLSCSSAEAAERLRRSFIFAPALLRAVEQKELSARALQSLCGRFLQVCSHLDQASQMQGDQVRSAPQAKAIEWAFFEKLGLKERLVSKQILTHPHKTKKLNLLTHAQREQKVLDLLLANKLDDWECCRQEKTKILQALVVLPDPPQSRGEQKQWALEILGVSSTAGPKEVQQAYKAKAKVFHPDRVIPGHSNAFIENQARKNFQHIGQAYALLCPT